MRELARVKLPDSFLGTNRNFCYGHSGHGDLILHFWNENSYQSNDQITGQTLHMSHGSDVELVAAAIGFYRRIGKPDTETKQTFIDAAEDIFQDPFVTEAYQRYKNFNHLKHIADGRFMPRFDNEVMGWHRLTHEISCQPGVPEEVGATALYTRQDIFGNHTLLFDSVVPEWVKNFPPELHDSELQKPKVVELAPQDMPVFAETVCESSMGEYRKDIYQFLISTFIN